MLKEQTQSIEKSKSQIEVDKNITDLFADISIKTSNDLVKLRDKILGTLENRPYNDRTKEHADSLQWKRTASEIISDRYVYDGKSCSDLVLVFLAVCKAKGIEGNLIKLVSTADNDSHSIVEVKLDDGWYRLDPSMPGFFPRKGQMTDEILRNNPMSKDWHIWKKGKDLWEMGLNGIEDERKLL